MSLVKHHKREILFLSFVGKDYSRSSTLLNYDDVTLSKTFKLVESKNSKILRDLRQLKKEINSDAVIVIMSPCHKIAILAKLILRNHVILDAGWPLLDGVLSRGWSWSWIYKVPVTFLIDFFSFMSADTILVESSNQMRKVSRYFPGTKRKLVTSFTGFDESQTKTLKTKSSVISNLITRDIEVNLPKRVLFRGKLNLESGLKNILGAAKLLDKEVHFILLTGTGTKRLDLKNVTYISEVSFDEMGFIYHFCDMALGQMSNHDRLAYTIPHKAFEAGFFATPYLSRTTPGLLEIYNRAAFVGIEDPSPESLANAIRELLISGSLERYSKMINESYKLKCSQQEINRKFSCVINELESKN